MATCQTTSSECEPTRILETISLDVVDTLPGVQPDQDALERRLESCFKLFSDGAFAQALHKHQKMLGELITLPESEKPLNDHKEHHPEYHKVFLELRGLLLLYLNKHPDKYNCTIDERNP